MTNYLALTIGPIYQTLRKARNTRELWAASYLFSKLMELLIKELTQKGAVVILPKKIEDSSLERYGAGIYNDRLFAEAGTITENQVNGIITDAVKKLADLLCPTGETADPDYWQQYLRIEWVMKPLESIEGGNLINGFANLLDTAELSARYFSASHKPDRMTQFLDKIYETKLKSALTGNALGAYKDMIKGLFPSTMDLATYELFQTDSQKYNELLKDAKMEAADTTDVEAKKIQAFFQKLETKGNAFESVFSDYHKYFCIVHADGDGIGQTIKTLDNKGEFSDFSEKLGKYAVAAAKVINDFGGKPVYIGGDDLLFFAPVCARAGDKTQSIFNLIKTLDGMFTGLGLAGSPTLSFGITFSYHKFPLFEAYDLSYKELGHRAKQVVWADGRKKNAVAFRLMKHTGSWFEGLFTKEQLDKLLIAETALRDADKDLLSSMVYKLDTLESLLVELDKQNTLEKNAQWLFKNFFNEPIHERNREQLEWVQKLLIDTYRQQAVVDEKPLDRSANLYAVLRILKFVTDRPQNIRPAQAANPVAETENESPVNPTL